jgi:hypothetical protein
MVTSRTNWAWSQTGVGGAEKVAVGRARVGKVLTEVLVAAGGGMVGVLKGVTWVVANVDMAWTVIAAAVNTAFGSSVAGLLVGRLQAERIKRMMNKMETGRTILGILFSSMHETILHPADIFFLCSLRGIPRKLLPTIHVACGAT